MDQQSTTASPPNGGRAPHDLFVLTDEQILEIEPEGEVNVAAGFSPASSPARVKGNAASPAVIPSEARDRGDIGESASSQSARQDPSVASLPRNDRMEQNAPSPTENGTRATGHEAQPGVAVPQEPPPWLAAQMKDPWSGEEAKELWNGVQQARQEAAAYRAAIATPEDARALKELYPGGVNEARAAANHAQLLNEIDRAYFGTAGATPEQTSAAREQLAALMLREDLAAFREMVFAGLRALEAAEKGSAGAANAPNLPRLAQVFAANRPDAHSAVGATLGSPARNLADLSTGGASPAPTAPSAVAAGISPLSDASLVGARHAVPASANTSVPDAPVAAYAAFEKAANDDLERSVGAAIARTIEQALPNLKGSNRGEGEGARHGVPLQDRLTAAVRQDVEAALKGDRQLGEQIAQILSARRFDNETRAQVVRLIDDRARQLVPGAARRVLNEWTQTTLAAHRSSAARADAASSRAEVATAAVAHGNVAQGESLPVRQAGPSPAAFSSRAAQTRSGADPHRGALRPESRRIDYRKLSDEQILEL